MFFDGQRPEAAGVAAPGHEASGTPDAPSRSPRIRTVDGLRGLAALLVIFDHTVGDSWGLGAWSAQNHGITIFAILTGFLLSAPFLRARLDGKPLPSVVRFLQTRAVRIYPGYWVALGLAALVVGLHSMGAGDGLRVVTLTQTFGTDTPFEGIPPTWSLSMFLTFYLLLPLWAWARARKAGRDPASIIRVEIALLLFVIFLSWVVRTTDVTAAFAPDPVFTVLGRADWFAIGMILMVVIVAAQYRGRWRVASLPGSYPGVAMLLALGLTISSALVPMQQEELRDQLDTAAAALLVAAAVLHGRTLKGPQRLLASRPARALGRWSFGIFLWGYILQKGIAQAIPGIGTLPHLLLTVAGAIALGAASWRFVEQPAMRLLRAARERRDAGRMRPVSGFAPRSAAAPPA
jgi:peptidoglycan/LPS O-acetylase OafA/YrhL